jgi:type IV secretion system protein VirB5
MPETLTPKQVLLTDEIANEKYVGFYAERRLSRMVITAGSVLLLGSFGVIVSLSHRPIQNRYIRIDEMGKATAIQYSDLAYSPREGEVRTYLTDWANYRYTINRETVSKKYPMNYYFLSTQLANQYMGEDNAMHLVSQVLANQIEQSDVEIDGVTITSMSQETVKNATMARGTALVNITKIYSPRNSRQPRKEHWVLDRPR